MKQGSQGFSSQGKTLVSLTCVLQDSVLDLSTVRFKKGPFKCRTRLRKTD